MTGAMLALTRKFFGLPNGAWHKGGEGRMVVVERVEKRWLVAKDPTEHDCWPLG